MARNDSTGNSSSFEEIQDKRAFPKEINILITSRSLRMKELYLDTNVWSELGRGKLSTVAIERWCNIEKGNVILSRFQLVELCRVPKLHNRILEIAVNLGAVLIDNHKNDFSGLRKQQVPYALYEPLNLLSSEERNLFAGCVMNSHDLKSVRLQLEKDGQSFNQEIETALQSVPLSRQRSWNDFNRGLKSWMEGRLKRQGLTLHHNDLLDPNRYAGLKLSFAIVFIRYYINRQQWRNSDYIDFLHCLDIAYADTVVTERNMATCLNQIKKKIPGLGPRQVYNFDWLKA